MVRAGGLSTTCCFTEAEKVISREGAKERRKKNLTQRYKDAKALWNELAS